MPNDNNSASAKAANLANQIHLFNRSGVIASLRMMNQQLRKAGDHLAYDDTFIDEHQDLDGLRDEMSTKLVAIGRGELMPEENAPDKEALQELFRRLECFGSDNVHQLCAQFGIEREHLLQVTRHPCHDDWVRALLAKPIEQVTAALDAMEASLDGEGSEQASCVQGARPRA